MGEGVVVGGDLSGRRDTAMRKSPVRRPDQREALDGLDRRTLDRGKRKRQKGNAFEKGKEKCREKGENNSERRANKYTHTHTQTKTEREIESARERASEREREIEISYLVVKVSAAAIYNVVHS
jgi:hypothetical protein